jgi:molecular chaperone GrpE
MSKHNAQRCDSGPGEAKSPEKAEGGETLTASNGMAPSEGMPVSDGTAPSGTPEPGCSCKAGKGESSRDLKEKVAALEAQLQEAKDQFLRKAADFENFRKRMNREKQEAIDFANQSLLLDLIPIMDDFERALKAAAGAAGEVSSSSEFTGLYEGISMIEKRLSSQLENKWGLKRFDSAGEAFDPNRHEALMMEKSPEIAEPVVQEDFLKGYSLKERIVRSAKVKVLMPENPQGTASSGAVQEDAGGGDPAANEKPQGEAPAS